MIDRLIETFELQFGATRRQAVFAAWTILLALLVILVALGEYAIGEPR